ncbi:uncharacterized protein CLUP02_04114 [Colletotrichum lupini]|uniref:Uncharacterized protein n=1 Tax=Colletotrichum lupini TaxID=145971 RepID=A0A9Q8WDD8_9PEZI|nr:uncharacterized protein CLUP02_04114 [Colletotrichum lupini]UQC78637.1 hypothetical protein CLUP02_04114 [Colletotrichum lupini]
MGYSAARHDMSLDHIFLFTFPAGKRTSLTALSAAKARRDGSALIGETEASAGRSYTGGPYGLLCATKWKTNQSSLKTHKSSRSQSRGPPPTLRHPFIMRESWEPLQAIRRYVRLGAGVYRCGLQKARNMARDRSILSYQLPWDVKCLGTVLGSRLCFHLVLHQALPTFPADSLGFSGIDLTFSHCIYAHCAASRPYNIGFASSTRPQSFRKHTGKAIRQSGSLRVLREEPAPFPEPTAGFPRRVDLGLKLSELKTEKPSETLHYADIFSQKKANMHSSTNWLVLVGSWLKFIAFGVNEILAQWHPLVSAMANPSCSPKRQMSHAP